MILGTVITLIDKRFVFALVDLRAGVAVVLFFLRLYSALAAAKIYRGIPRVTVAITKNVVHFRYLTRDIKTLDCLHLHGGERLIAVIAIY